MAGECRIACGDCFIPEVVNQKGSMISNSAAVISEAIGNRIILAASFENKTREAVEHGLPADVETALEKISTDMRDRVADTAIVQGEVVDECERALADAQEINCAETTEYFEDICPRLQRLIATQDIIFKTIDSQ